MTVSSAKQEHNGLRFDLQLIASWVEPGAKVLDLGCGSGDLLYFLKETKQVIGTGIDRHEPKVAECIAKGLTVLQGDLNEEVMDYEDDTFDYVVLSQTLQQVYDPERLLRTLLRIGRNVVVSFPNFSHWASRLQLFFQGHAPRTKQLPFAWYNTPNIRVVTIKDFKDFAKAEGFIILNEVAINSKYEDKQGSIVRALPNLRATYGIFMIGRERRKWPRTREN